MLKILLWLIVVLALATFCYANHHNEALKFYYDVSLGALGLIIPLSWYYWKDVDLILRTQYRGTNDLRASFAYLIRIEVKDEFDVSKYLLVKNSKLNGYQPPGGVYKYFNKSTLEKMSVQDHPLLHKKEDLRLKLKRKNYPKLLEWFVTGKERECSPEREFYEELIETNVLNQKLFPYGKFSIIRNFRSNVKWSKELLTDEIKYFDVFNLNLNKEQNEHLIEMMTVESEDFKFVSEDEIIRGGFSPTRNKDKMRILEQTILLIKDKL